MVEFPKTIVFFPPDTTANITSNVYLGDHLCSSFHFLSGNLRCFFSVVHMFFLHAAIYVVKCSRPSCSKSPPQHDAATLVFHGWDGVLGLAGFPLYLPNVTIIFGLNTPISRTSAHMTRLPKRSLCP